MRSPQEIREQIGALRVEIRRLEDELNVTKLRGCPLAVGDRFTFIGDWKARAGDYIVARIDTTWGTTWQGANVYAHPIRKDGSPSKRAIFVGIVRECKKVES